MKKGVSLISLVVTIIVLIILAGISIMTIQNNNPIDKAKDSVSESDREACRDELRISIANRLKDNPLLQKNSINASTFEDMKKYIPSLTKEIAEKYEIVNGELVLRGTEGLDPDDPNNLGPGGNDNVDPDNPDIENNRPPKPEDDPYDMGTPNMPELASGMIPIKFNGENWEICSRTDPEWYNYAFKKWANIMLTDGTYTDKDAIGQIVKDEELGSMFVWIPRFAYSINEYRNFKDFEEIVNHNDNRYGEIETNKPIFKIKFLKDATDKDADNVKYEYKYDQSLLKVGEPTPMIVHSAFNHDDKFLFIPTQKQLKGIWVAKFEASVAEKETSKDITIGTTTVAEEEDPEYLKPFFNSSDKTIKILPKKYHWLWISIGDAFKVCYEMKNKEIYGLSDAQPHLIKNQEWGAVAYLTASVCGTVPKLALQIDNNVYSPKTGGEDYKKNLRYSTTGNITGIYDMNGGLDEYVAAYWLTHPNFIKYANTTFGSDETKLFNWEGKVNKDYTKYFEKYPLITAKNKEDTGVEVYNEYYNLTLESRETPEERKIINQKLIDQIDRQYNELKNNFGIALFETLDKPAYPLYFSNIQTGYYLNVEDAAKLNNKEGFSYNIDKTIFHSPNNFSFILRGGDSHNGGKAGIFAFTNSIGQKNVTIGFRPSIFVR